MSSAIAGLKEKHVVRRLQKRVYLLTPFLLLAGADEFTMMSRDLEDVWATKIPWIESN